MKTSARNSFKGKISSVKKGPVHTEVTLELPGGMEVVATVTTTSAEKMGLEKGLEATAMVKATHVMLVTD